MGRVSSPPPGWRVVVRHAPSRSYNVCVSPTGVVCKSIAAAWRFVERPSDLPDALPCVPDVCEHEPASVVVSPPLASVLCALSMPVSALPAGVTSCVVAAASLLCNSSVRGLARAYVVEYGSDLLPAPASCVFPSSSSAASDSRDEAQTLVEIAALRRVLPSGCEVRMSGSQHSFAQAPPAMRWRVLRRKFLSAAGRRGANCARDRRALSRYLTFCAREGVVQPFPVGAVVFTDFIDHCFSASRGKKGGATVMLSLKQAFVHMSEHFGLLTEFDAPVLFNTVKPYRGDSDTATSPSLWCLHEWERLAVEASSPALRLVCQVAVLATWLSLRAVHFVGATVLPSSTESSVQLNLAKDKDGSTNVWVGCDAAGLCGVFSWWVELVAAATGRGYLVPSIAVSVPDDPLSGEVSLGDSPIDSRGMVLLYRVAFALVGISPSMQAECHFTGHSPRHFAPCVAEVLMWLDKLRDELGRWATGAANVKRTKCGPRYTVSANRGMQIALRRYIRDACLFLCARSEMGPASLLPDFTVLATHPEVVRCPHYGSAGVGVLPKSA